jgi:hypothetical protein
VEIEMTEETYNRYLAVPPSGRGEGVSVQAAQLVWDRTIAFLHEQLTD